MKNIIFAMFLMLSMFACAQVDSPDSSVELSSTSQAVVDCEQHPAVCEAFERLCERLPNLCEELCEEHPNLPFCQTGGQCLDVGETCVDEEDPNYVPCCGFEEGTADCFLDFETGTYSCRAISQCEGPVNGQDCLPEGPACCPDPNGAPTVCEATDPSDPNTSYICTPAP